MSLTPSQRLSNLEAGLIAAQKRISELATDSEIFSLSNNIEEQIFALANSIEAMKNQLAILEKILERVQVERQGEQT